LSGDGYIESGGYLSEIYDSGSNTSVYYILSIGANIPADTFLDIQIRASNDSSMTGSTWSGPDGTSNTNYSSSEIFYLQTSIYGRYFQYKASFTSDTENTPLLKEIIINFKIKQQNIN